MTAEEFKQLKDIERLIGQIIPREIIDGFEPSEKVPASKLDTRPPKPKRPKKPNSQNTSGFHQRKRQKT